MASAYHACSSATARALERAVGSKLVHADHVRKLGKLTVAGIGFGAYRVGAKSSYDAMSTALTSGAINLVETSTHYGKKYAGQSEEMIGAVLRDNASRLKREEIVIVTKLGHVPKKTDPDANPVGDVDLLDRPSKEALEDDGKAEEVTATEHSLEPGFILDEFRASCARLGTKPDVVMLHNPEFYLSQCLRERVPLPEAWDEMYRRMENAFATLEALRTAGEIHGYGVSGNFLSCYFSVNGRTNRYEALDIQRTIGAAIDAASRKKAVESVADTGLMSIQTPLNLIECGVTYGRARVIPGFEGEPDAAVCQRNGIALVGNRPLTAIPPPGLTTRDTDWGHTDSHAKFAEFSGKPMGSLQRLFKKTIVDGLKGEAGVSDDLTLQQLTLLCCLSSDFDPIVLNGMRKEAYVQDALVALRLPKVDSNKVKQIEMNIRAITEEMGGKREGLW